MRQYQAAHNGGAHYGRVQARQDSVGPYHRRGHGDGNGAVAPQHGLRGHQGQRHNDANMQAGDGQQMGHPRRAKGFRHRPRQLGADPQKQRLRQSRLRSGDAALQCRRQRAADAMQRGCRRSAAAGTDRLRFLRKQYCGNSLGFQPGGVVKITDGLGAFQPAGQAQGIAIAQVGTAAPGDQLRGREGVHQQVGSRRHTGGNPVGGVHYPAAEAEPAAG